MNQIIIKLILLISLDFFHLTDANCVNRIKSLDVGVNSANDAITNRKNLVTGLTNSNKCITFDSGDYLIDNSGSTIVISNFVGQIFMDSGSRILFTNKTNKGIVFDSGNGAKFDGLKFSFHGPMPDLRIGSNELIEFQNTSNTIVTDIYINGSAAAGLIFYNCIRPVVRNARINNTMADGLHFANCENPQAENIFVENSGDDGLAFVNYDRSTYYSGGYANNITVHRSKARGIAVPGQSGVWIRNFLINQTSVCGVYVAYETSYKLRVPSDVLIENGVVYNGGSYPGQKGLQYGLGFFYVGRNITFRNITIETPKTRGVSGAAYPFNRTKFDGSIVLEPAGYVNLSQITVKNTPNSGFDLLGGHYKLDNVKAIDTNFEAFVFTNSEEVTYSNITVINASANHSLHRAVTFGNNKKITGSSIVVEDNKSVATGYIVKTYGTESGNIGTIYDRITNGHVIVENDSKLLYKITKL